MTICTFILMVGANLATFNLDNVPCRWCDQFISQNTAQIVKTELQINQKITLTCKRGAHV